VNAQKQWPNKRSTIGRFSRHWHHHAKLYFAFACGAGAFGAAWYLKAPMPEAVAADTFFAAFLAAFVITVPWDVPQKLKERAQIEDEGALFVSVIIFAAIAYCCWAIFKNLNGKELASPLWRMVSLAGAPLGWFVIHCNETLHYSNLYYKKSPRGDKHEKSLGFPGTDEPCAWDFFYFSMVVGMTAQTSDVEVRGYEMRRRVTIHAFVSFFFNTVLIAMAVNAAVSK
jgi:uncharacterized membrane protein